MDARTEQLVILALEEDIGSGDVTAQALGSSDFRVSAQIISKESLVVCGLGIARFVFERVDPGLVWETACCDGDAVEAGAVVATIRGARQGIVTAERTALNFLQNLSGVSTNTRRYVKAVEGTGVILLDTRKTWPGYRHLQKQAVLCGGGQNHRMGLYDQYLIKENHLAGNAISEVVKKVRAHNTRNLLIEIEIEHSGQIEEAIAAGVDRLLLDNMSPVQIRQAVSQIAGRVKTEASGGITLENIREYAETGVDSISVGALTHSVRAVDLSLIVESCVLREVH